jgi:A nuclease family of the HNH/ENDO VII superfamily with conserved AHH
MTMLAAANAGSGGKPLTNQTVDEARFNLTMAWADVAMAGLELGLETKVIQRLASSAGRLAVGGVRLSRQQWSAGLAASRRGAAALKKWLSQFPLPQRQALEPVLAGVPTRGLDDVPGTNQPLRSTGAGGTTIPANIRGYQNAADVAPLLGRKFVPGATPLPAGYRYAQIPDGKGGFKQVIYMPESNGKMVPLKVDKDGKIQAGAKGQYRVVNSDAYNANFVTVPGRPGFKVFQGKGESWVHHIVPDNVMRANPVYQRAFELGLLNPDRASNLIELARDSKALADGRQLLRNNNLPENLVSDITHYTQHRNYDQLVGRQLDTALERLQQQKGLGHLEREAFIRQMSRDDLKNFITNMENKMRGGFMGTDQQLFRQMPRRPNGSLSQNPEESNSEVA